MGVKWLAQGHIAGKYLRPDLSLGPPTSRPGSQFTELPRCSLQWNFKKKTNKHSRIAHMRNKVDYRIIDLKLKRPLRKFSEIHFRGQLGSLVNWEPGLKTGGPRLKSGLRHFPAMWPWASHLTPKAYPYHSSALEPIHSIDSKTEGKGLKKVHSYLPLHMFTIQRKL